MHIGALIIALRMVTWRPRHAARLQPAVSRWRGDADVKQVSCRSQ
jgi:hypothetical protein